MKIIYYFVNNVDYFIIMKVCLICYNYILRYFSIFYCILFGVIDKWINNIGNCRDDV